ncbi:MAG TPA: SPFH domain-containing protein, partial [Thermoanaerobaculia bacterium]|nr:SPFH domain-containing protein [Thermoanaerobaculia bacterium]
MLRERSTFSLPGLLTFPLLLVAIALFVRQFSRAATSGAAGSALFSIVAAAIAFFLLFGHFRVEPNQGKVLLLFGAYRGTVRQAGLRWANPLLSKRSLSLRVRNFETERLKVNDH